MLTLHKMLHNVDEAKGYSRIGSPWPLSRNGYTLHLQTLPELEMSLRGGEIYFVL
jgi:hypothetical protein